MATAAPLNPEQLSAVLHRGGHLVVVAGAGTGKTHTLVCRCASLISDGFHPFQLMVLAFTNAAADEIKARVSAHVPNGGLITSGTFHSVAFRQLRRHGHLIGLDSFEVMDSADAESLLSMLRKELGLEFPQAVKSRRLLELFSFEANTFMPLAGLCVGTCLEDVTGSVLLLQDAFFRYKKDNRCLDYDDLLHAFLELLNEHPDAVADFRHVLVDECQDTNPLQLAILRRLMAIGLTLTAVGDPCQSIYAFRGANPAVMQELAASSDVIVLRRNYRSGQRVLDYANQVIRACPGLIRADLVSEGLSASAPSFFRFPTENIEALQVAHDIRRLLDSGTPPHDVAVLYSSSQHGVALQADLMALRVPYLTKGGLRLHDTAHVRDMLALLRLSLDNRHPSSLRRVLPLILGIGGKSPLFRDPLASVPKKAKARYDALLACLRVMSYASPSAAWQQALQWYGPLISKPHHRYELEQFGSSLADCADLRAFLDTMALDSAPQQDGKGKVCLSTVHSAKGREWRHVYVIGLAEGRFTRAAFGTPEYHEAVRLFYVACTRAKQHLTVTVPQFCRQHDGSFRHARSSSLLP